MATPNIPVTSGWGGSGVTGSTGGTGTGLDYTSLILAGGTGVASAIANSKKSKADREQALLLQQQQLAAAKAAQEQSTAFDESKLDPFRQQMSQANDLASLDKMERATYTPVRLTPSGPYASYVPHLFGGSSYEKSPELIASAASLKKNIMGGNVDPSMTNPNNYGKTGALDLVSMASAGVDPSKVSFRGVRPGDVTGQGSNGTAGAALGAGPGSAAPTADGNFTDYGYTPPADGDLSVGFSENHYSQDQALKGAGEGALVGAKFGGIGAGYGAAAGAIMGAIKGRTNDTKNQRETFAKNLGFTDAKTLYDHLKQTLPPNVAWELENRALNRIGKHDVTANQKWMEDVAKALDSAQNGAGAASTSSPFTGRG